MSQKSQDSTAKQTVPKPDLTPAVEHLTAEGPTALAAAALQRLATSPDEPLNPGDVLALQRTLGNQLVQRTLAAGVAGRGGVHRGPALVTTRARAAIQRAGTGIAKGETVDDFAEGARGVQSEWADLSASQRANKLGALANAALASVKVPEVTILMTDLGKGSGAFNSGSWTLKINTNIVSKDTVTEAEMAALSDTFYHEARHAEQFYRVARYVAGLGKSATYISTRLGIPGRIANEATRNKLKEPGVLDELMGTDKELAQEIAEAKEWTEALGPRGQKRYAKVSKELKAASKALDDALAAYKASPTDENKAKVIKARNTYNKKYRAYRNFADEKDAWKVGGKAGEAFKSAGSEND